MPSIEKGLLLNWGDESAEASTNVRARDSRGNRGGSDSRAWRAESFAELWTASTGGDGSWRSRSSARGSLLWEVRFCGRRVVDSSEGEVVDCRREKESKCA